MFYVIVCIFYFFYLIVCCFSVIWVLLPEINVMMMMINHEGLCKEAGMTVSSLPGQICHAAKLH